ncbi:MAG: hypothetical protein HY319_23180 [Armatimonadetes bacterium]|nr:hypothetical protein [Armatimonadota bacterium]
MVLKTGIDVGPSHHHTFVDFLEKALEYGGWPKLILALRSECLDRTFREVPRDTPPEEIAALKALFPTVLESNDGMKLWLSRLPHGDSALATSYEWSYAAWIPGDALDALTAVILAAHPRRGGTERFSTRSLQPGLRGVEPP